MLAQGGLAARLTRQVPQALIALQLDGGAAPGIEQDVLTTRGSEGPQKIRPSTTQPAPPSSVYRSGDSVTSVWAFDLRSASAASRIASVVVDAGSLVKQFRPVSLQLRTGTFQGGASSL